MSIKNFIKIDVHLFHNNKFKLIKSIEKRNWVTLLWIRLLTEAGLVNDKGLIYLAKDMPYTLEMLSDLFENPIEDIKSGLDTLVSLAMIKIHDDNIIEIINWCKYQEPKRKAKKVKEEITESVENQGTDKCDTTVVEDRTSSEDAIITDIQNNTSKAVSTIDDSNDKIENNTLTTDPYINPTYENDISEEPIDLSSDDEDENEEYEDVDTPKYDPHIDIIGVKKQIAKYESYDTFYEGKFRPEGKVLCNINFTETESS